MKKHQAVTASDIKVVNGKFRDFVLSNGAQFLSKYKKLLWYSETLVLSARYLQLLEMSGWGKSSKRYHNRYILWESALVPRIKNSATVLEFGVAAGAATQWWAGQNLDFSEWHGFDTFTGLPEPWSRGGVAVMAAGVFDQTGSKDIFPNVKASYRVTWHKGLISDTFVNRKFEVPRERQLIIFIDVDLYAPTREVLEYLAKFLKPGDLIYFDEGFDPWNEGRALQESLPELPYFQAIGHTGSALLIEFK